ncbi:hypothetical protein KY290_001810 [Solanum tuberosum]|uniref:Uncharacterized protein n=1 Tax=Solanum tuberosum TaxID=4113 RepID=A0ABQ7WN90_SOLTU|nr:hypothetical protein KY290_001810 [Solanum tuberosum]
MDYYFVNVRRKGLSKLKKSKNSYSTSICRSSKAGLREVAIEEEEEELKATNETHTKQLTIYTTQNSGHWVVVDEGLVIAYRLLELSSTWTP